MSIRHAPAITEASTAGERPALPTSGSVDSVPVLRSVASRDGTTIGYRQVGSGPALILLHGSMSSGAHHVELARLLSDTFTVFVPDRRGRALSPDPPRCWA